MKHRQFDRLVLEEILKSNKNCELLLDRDSYALPTIQRHSSWTSGDVKCLFDEIKSLFVCNSQRVKNGESPWKRNIGDFVIDNRALVAGTERKAYIVDGQQRSINFTVCLCAIRDLISEKYVGNLVLFDISIELDNYLVRKEARKRFPKIELKTTLNNSIDLFKIVVDKDTNYINGNIDKDLHNVLYVYNEWKKRLKLLNEDELEGFYVLGLKYMTMSVHYIEEDHEINEEFIKRNSSLGRKMTTTQKCNARVASYVDEMEFATPAEKGKATKCITKLVSNEFSPAYLTLYNAGYTANNVKGEPRFSTAESKIIEYLNVQIDNARACDSVRTFGKIDNTVGLKLLDTLSKSAENVYNILTRNTGTDFDQIAPMYLFKNGDDLINVTAIELFGLGKRYKLKLRTNIEIFDIIFGIALKSKLYRDSFLGTQEKTAIPKIFNGTKISEYKGHLCCTSTIHSFIEKQFEKIYDIEKYTDDVKESFINRLANADLDSSGMRGLFCCILSRIIYEESGETEIIDWIDSTKDITLEHIIAKSTNPSNCIGSLGNLTFIERKLNSSAGAKSTKDKKDIYSQSNISMTRELDSKYPLDKFDETTIKQRSRDLAEKIYNYIHSIY